MTTKVFTRRRVGLAGLILLIGVLLGLLRLTRTTVTLDVGGKVQRYHTRADTVGDLLTETHLQIDPEDVVWPAPDTHLKNGMTITVDRAHAVALDADGLIRQIRTQSTHPLAILAEQAITVGTYDLIQVDGRDYVPERIARQPWTDPPHNIRVIRSQTLTVSDQGRTLLIHTTQDEVGQALDNAGVDLYLADRVTPGFNAPAQDGQTISIERSYPLTVAVDGRELVTRAVGPTVGDALAQIGIAPVGQDVVDPPEDTPLEPDMAIRIVRVTVELETEQETIPFKTIYWPDPTLAPGAQRTIQDGQTGLRQRTIRVRIEDGQPVSRTVEHEWIAQPAQPRIIGTGIE